MMLALRKLLLSAMIALLNPLFLCIAILVFPPFALAANPPQSATRISVVGAVFCDACATSTFSRHSYFLPGAEVHISCRFDANSPRTSEHINVSVNRTTDKYGVYKLEIPSVEGIDCVERRGIATVCEATLLGSSSECNVQGLKTTTNEITLKSKQDNLCLYSLDALSYRPPEINTTVCSAKTEFSSSLNSSKCFLPYFPWPPLPPLPAMNFPPLPPLPSIPPFPAVPSIPPPPPPPPPPAFNLGDPRTWIPHLPPVFSPPPPPAFNLGDPRTWIPNIPSFVPPPPPAFNLGDPRTWVPSLAPPAAPPFNLLDPRTWRWEPHPPALENENDHHQKQKESLSFP